MDFCNFVPVPVLWYRKWHQVGYYWVPTVLSVNVKNCSTMKEVVICHTFSSDGINEYLSFGLDPDLNLTELTTGRIRIRNKQYRIRNTS